MYMGSPKHARTGEGLTGSIFNAAYRRRGKLSFVLIIIIITTSGISFQHGTIVEL